MVTPRGFLLAGGPGDLLWPMEPECDDLATPHRLALALQSCVFGQRTGCSGKGLPQPESWTVETPRGGTQHPVGEPRVDPASISHPQAWLGQHPRALLQFGLKASRPSLSGNPGFHLAAHDPSSQSHSSSVLFTQRAGLGAAVNPGAHRKTTLGKGSLWM